MPVRRSSLLALFATLLPAQDRDLPVPAPALKVLTRDLALVERLQDVFLAPRHDYALPQDIGYCLFTVQADGKVEQTTVRALMRPGTWAEFFLKPAIALQALQNEVAEVRRLVQPRLDAVLVQLGYPQGFGKRLWNDVQSVLTQTSGIYLKVEGDPREVGKALTVTLDLVPEPDTALHRWLKVLQPSPKGALPLPDGRAAGKLQLSLHPDRLAALVAPFARFMVESGDGSAEERQARQDDFDRDLELWDGTLSLQVGESGTQLFLGSKQPEASARMIADPARLQREQESFQRRRIELSFKHAALQHRGVNALAVESASDLPTGDLPSAMASYRAVAGACKVLIAAPKLPAETMRSAIDRCLDGKLAPVPLAGGAVLQVDLDTELVQAMLPAQMAPAGDAPSRRIRLTMLTIGITLELKLELR
jgi:hypothetical protein